MLYLAATRGAVGIQEHVANTGLSDRPLGARRGRRRRDPLRQGRRLARHGWDYPDLKLVIDRGEVAAARGRLREVTAALLAPYLGSVSSAAIN